jgi:hypothetical protein
VISPKDPRIRKIDEVDKVDLYQRVGVPEYLLVELPRRLPDRFGIFGYRLDSAGTYQRIVPDAESGLLSETTGLWFGISPEGGSGGGPRRRDQGASAERHGGGGGHEARGYGPPARG